jgi:hypothetical protein
MEVTMKILPILMVLAGIGCITALASLPSAAATSSAMKACSHQWSVMKKANKVPEGQKWSDFWSQCSKDYAAKNGSEPATEKPAKTTKTAAVSEDDSSGSAQTKRDCDDKWGAYKTKTGAHGWHDYFQFMSKCM